MQAGQFVDPTTYPPPLPLGEPDAMLMMMPPPQPLSKAAKTRRSKADKLAAAQQHEWPEVMLPRRP